MIIVLDTSAGAEIVLHRKRAEALTQHIQDAEWVFSPALYVPEITNTFWKYYRFSDMPIEECEKRVEQAIAIPDEYISEKTLYKEAFSMACLTQKPVYDMFFLVLARRNNALLLTLDNLLRETAKKNSIRVF